MSGLPTLRALYRYSPGPGAAPRPDGFSKLAALTTFARAVRAAGSGVHCTFVVDGEADDETTSLMRALGEVRRGTWGSNRTSYRATVALPRIAGYDEDLVWLAEDDYAYEECALLALREAANAVPEAGWFALSGPTPPHLLEMRTAQGPVAVPPLPGPSGLIDVHGRPWRRIDSTTSTFGGRRVLLLRDERMLRALPWSGAAWDRTTCLALQGITPYPWAHLLDDLLVASTPREHRAARVAYRVASRVAANARAQRLPWHREPLIAPAVPLVGHLSLPFEERPGHWRDLMAAAAP